MQLDEAIPADRATPSSARSRGAGRRLVCALLAAGAPLSIANAQPEWASAFVAGWETASHAIAAAPDPALAAQRCGELIHAAVDVDALSDGVATAVQAGAQQRQSLRTAVKRKLVADCVRRRHDYDGATLSLLGVRETGGEALITAKVGVRDRPDRRLVWRFEGPAGARPKASDVVLQGLSMSAETRAALTTLLRSRQGNLDRAIEALGGGQ